jgi:hypothetical protein
MEALVLVVELIELFKLLRVGSKACIAQRCSYRHGHIWHWQNMGVGDKGIVSFEVDGCDVGSVEGFNPHDKVISPFMDMELYFGEEPILLSFCPMVVNEMCRVRRVFCLGFAKS